MAKAYGLAARAEGKKVFSSGITPGMPIESGELIDL
tara:strand:- start:446 stop:553 length:108 start_codon:yes stop_codon:yes gene_type:complete